MTLNLNADLTSVDIPAEAPTPGAPETKVEVLAREKSGNQTITEMPFWPMKRDRTAAAGRCLHPRRSLHSPRGDAECDFDSTVEVYDSSPSAVDPRGPALDEARLRCGGPQISRLGRRAEQTAVTSVVVLFECPLLEVGGPNPRSGFRWSDEQDSRSPNPIRLHPPGSQAPSPTRHRHDGLASLSSRSDPRTKRDENGNTNNLPVADEPRITCVPAGCRAPG